MNILIIAEHHHGQLSPLLFNTLEAAKAFSGTVDVMVLGHHIEPICQTIQTIPGIRTCFYLDDPQLSHPLAEVYAPIIAAQADAYDVVMMQHSTTTKDILPRVAAQLKLVPITDVTAILAKDTFERPIYAGNAIQKLKSNQTKQLLSIRTTKFKPQADADTTSGHATCQAIEQTIPTAKTQWVSEATPESERPELTAAKIIVSGGRGVGSEAQFNALIELADQLGAAVGASRAAVDAGFVPNDYQVGQTGKIVAPDLYLCFGISGAIQHLAGIKDSQVIIAVNKDPEAPIFEVADYGYVGDLFTVLDALKATMAQPG